ncbi:hypothetical protein, partial [Terrimonas ferruginea]|uniref:hypothetical protein n=1 Tax=Terrimonas ferruginea TaxID=249 RepID=UPI001B7F9FFF
KLTTKHSDTPVRLLTNRNKGYGIRSATSLHKRRNFLTSTDVFPIVSLPPQLILQDVCNNHIYRTGACTTDINPDDIGYYSR